jgi:hypothetical protein
VIIRWSAADMTTRRLESAPGVRARIIRLAFDGEILVVAALLVLTVAVALWTVGDYAITVDEFNADDYGSKSLAWYTSFFTDRSVFDSVEETLWFYGPWFHILTTLAQSLDLADHWTTRHVMTFLLGLAALAALLPIARLAAGRWAGFIAIGLCLTTGYLYGSMFVTPIDVPFMFAMTWATLAIMLMAVPVVPLWPATIATGLLTGLAIATRSSGLITHVYLIGAMSLCAAEALMRDGHAAGRDLMRIGVRTISAMLIAWLTAIALWPWLQVGNPIARFGEAFRYFANHPGSFQFSHWGEMVLTTALPWSYVPAQLLVRLPEGFLLLLGVAAISGIGSVIAIPRARAGSSSQPGWQKLKQMVSLTAQARQPLIVWAAAISPVAAIVVLHSTLYDGIRHVLFLIPILAVVASFGLLRLLPLLRRHPAIAAAGAGAYVTHAMLTLVLLHPLEYAAFNVVAGGVSGAHGRFEQDYWSLAVLPALRQLEDRIDREDPERFATNPPSIKLCIGFHEASVAPMFRRPWQVEMEAGRADFVIDSERWHCAKGLPLLAIDELKRFDLSFARVYTRQSAAIGAMARDLP